MKFEFLLCISDEWDCVLILVIKDVSKKCRIWKIRHFFFDSIDFAIYYHWGFMLKRGFDLMITDNKNSKINADKKKQQKWLLFQIKCSFWDTLYNTLPKTHTPSFSVTAVYRISRLIINYFDIRSQVKYFRYDAEQQTP